MTTSSKLHSSSLLYIVICLLCITAFCIVGIYPNMAGMKELDDDFQRFNAEAQRQELLFPVYTRLIKEIQNQPPALTLPQKTKMDRNQIAQIDADFIKLAQKNGVIFDSAVLDASSYLEDSGQLTLNLTVHGDFFNFQKLLVDICLIPFLTSIDEVSILPYDDDKQMKVKLRLDQQ